MTISAADVLSTLVLVAPGFLGLKAFYLVAPAVRRTDAGWLIWSLIVAAPIVALAVLIGNAISPWAGITGLATAGSVDALFLVSLYSLGIGAGLFCGILWDRVLAPRVPNVQLRALGPAWDGILARGGWLTVYTTDGAAVFGFAGLYGSAGDTADSDIYLLCPAWLDRYSGAFTSLEPTECVWINRAQSSTSKCFAKRRFGMSLKAARRRASMPSRQRHRATCQANRSSCSTEVRRAGEASPRRPGLTTMMPSCLPQRREVNQGRPEPVRAATAQWAGHLELVKEDVARDSLEVLALALNEPVTGDPSESSLRSLWVPGAFLTPEQTRRVLSEVAPSAEVEVLRSVVEELRRNIQPTMRREELS